MHLILEPKELDEVIAAMRAKTTPDAISQRIGADNVRSDVETELDFAMTTYADTSGQAALEIPSVSVFASDNTSVRANIHLPCEECGRECEPPKLRVKSKKAETYFCAFCHTKNK